MSAAKQTMVQLAACTKAAFVRSWQRLLSCCEAGGSCARHTRSGLRYGNWPPLTLRAPCCVLRAAVRISTTGPCPVFCIFQSSSFLSIAFDTPLVLHCIPFTMAPKVAIVYVRVFHRPHHSQCMGAQHTLSCAIAPHLDRSSGPTEWRWLVTRKQRQC